MTNSKTPALPPAQPGVVDQGATPSDSIKTVGFKSLDVANLYRIDTFTDHVVGEIRVAVPITLFDTAGLEGYEVDRVRPLRFFSTMMVHVNGQANNIAFEIAATTLAEAITKTPEAAEAAGRVFLKQLQDQRARRPIIMPAGASGLPS